MALNNRDHHFIHQIAMNICHQLLVEQKVIGGVRRKMVENFQVLANVAQDDTAARMAQLFQVIDNLFALTHKGVGVDHQMQQATRHRSMFEQVQYFIYQFAVGKPGSRKW